MQRFIDDEKRVHWDYKRVILYAGFKFSDMLLLSTEYEREQACASSTDGGTGIVSLAVCQYRMSSQPGIQYSLRQASAPFGFLIEIVEPPHHLGNRRQEVETQIIPGTWREEAPTFSANWPAAPGSTVCTTSPARMAPASNQPTFAVRARGGFGGGE